MKPTKVHLCFEHTHPDPEIGAYWFVLDHMSYDLNDVNWDKARTLAKGMRFGYIPTSRMRSKRHVITQDVKIMS